MPSSPHRRSGGQLASPVRSALRSLPLLALLLLGGALAQQEGTGGADLTAPFALVLDTMRAWLTAALTGLPNLLVAVVVVLVFWGLARGARVLVQRLLRRVADNLQIVRLLGTIAYLAVLAAGTFIALGILQLTGVVTSLLAGVGIIGLALGFAFQDLAANFMSGVLMAIRQPFRIDDIIETADHVGVVDEVTLRATTLRTFQGQRVIVPNQQVFGNPIVNYSHHPLRRIDLSCGVAYGDDLEQARRIAIEAIEGLELRSSERPVELFYTEFGASSIDFTLRFWIDFEQQTDYLAARSEAIMTLKSAFDDSGVTIPFPIRTLDFGVVGGVPLAEAWPRGAAESGADATSG